MKNVVFPIISVIILLSVILLSSADPIRTLYSPLLPATCSDANIKALWDSVFQESSNYTVIKRNAQSADICNYLAYKEVDNKTYLITGTNDDYFTAIVAEYNSSSAVKTAIAAGNTDYDYENSAIEALSRRLVLSDVGVVDDSFKASFKLSSGNWSFENSTLCNGSICDKYSLWEQKEEYAGARIDLIKAQVFSNFSFISFYYSSNCQPNWSCNLGNWSDMNDCYKKKGMPNETSVCGSCISNWSCSNWTECADNQQTRICSDTNSCGNALGKPNETSTCISCVPKWNCTNWLPKTCPKDGNQTRICTDINTCNNNENKPTENQTCVYKSNTGLIVIVVVILLVLAAIPATFFILRASRKSGDGNLVIAPKPPTEPGPPQNINNFGNFPPNPGGYPGNPSNQA